MQINHQGYKLTILRMKSFQWRLILTVIRTRNNRQSSALLSTETAERKVNNFKAATTTTSQQQDITITCNQHASQPLNYATHVKL